MLAEGFGVWIRLQEYWGLGVAARLRETRSDLYRYSIVAVPFHRRRRTDGRTDGPSTMLKMLSTPFSLSVSSNPGGPNPYTMSSSRRDSQASNDPSVAAATAALAAGGDEGGGGLPVGNNDNGDDRRRKERPGAALPAAATAASPVSDAAATSPSSSAAKKSRLNGVSSINSSKLALFHVLGGVCRFPDGSAVVSNALRGTIASVDALCNLTDDQVSALFSQEAEEEEVDHTGAVEDGEGAVGAAAAAAAAARRSEMETLQLLKMWRSHMYLANGGTYPTSDDWRRLGAADFQQFWDLVRRPVGASDSATNTVNDSLPVGAAATPPMDKSRSSAASPQSETRDPAGGTPPSPGSHMPSADLDEAKQLAEDFVKSVMGKKPEPILGSDGMLVMRKVVTLERGVARDVVIRKVTRPFWQACIDAVDPPPPPPPPPSHDSDRATGAPGQQAATPTEQLRVCAVGTPGIGKTTCTPFLIRMLLMVNKTVVYHMRAPRDAGWMYEFIPGSNDGDPVTANVYPEQAFKSGVPSLREPSTFYVVDPGKTTDSCDPSSLFRPKVIIVASPDSKHWGANEFRKERADLEGVIKVYPVWELEELLQARQFFRRKMTIEEIEKRYLQVGGVPRHIFAGDESYAEIVRSQVVALRRLAKEQVE
jgi:hypothetical protein